MPNLISYIDDSDYYKPDIEIVYNFSVCKIDTNDYILKYAESVLNGENIYLYLLTDLENNHLSILKLTEKTINNKLYHQINKSFSIKPQQGYGQLLYRNVFNIHSRNIVSDSINTLPGSFNLWKKILRQKNSDILRFDTKNNRTYGIPIQFDEFLIWGVKKEFLEIILETPWEAVILDNDLDSDLEDDLGDFVDYLSLHDRLERTILTDYLVDALKKKNKIKSRENIVLLIRKE